MSTVLVCGGSGFIGQNIIAHLLKNTTQRLKATHFHSPIPIHLQNQEKLHWVRCDLTDKQSVKAILSDVEIVIQAAATTSGASDIVSRPAIHVTDNAVMNSLLVRAAAEMDVRHFIFFSCSVMYPSRDIPWKEEEWNPSLPTPKKYYGAASTKIYIENILNFFSQNSDMKTTAIRHSNVYGPHDKFDLIRSHVFGATVTKVLTAKKTIEVWGDGSERRDLVYVDDLCHLVRDIITKQQTKFEIYHCGSGSPIAVSDLVRKIIDSSGKSVGISYNESRPSIKVSVALDFSKTRNDLGWEPLTSLSTGIEHTIQWWSERYSQDYERLLNPVKKHV